ncbi:hypothetical protein IAT38_003123 [Cryptococcus sp. DSM 104549]
MSGTSDDRTKPRDLTFEDLWEAWSADPVWHDDLWEKSKYAIFTTIMLLTPGLPPPRHVFLQKGEWERDESVAVDLDGKIKRAEAAKEKGNKMYRDKEVASALGLYMLAWIELLPWHAAAFSPSDPIRTKFIKCETAILGNLTATLITMGKAGLTVDRRARAEVESMAYICAWCVLEDKECAAASTVRNACHRILFKPIAASEGPSLHDAERAELFKYYREQAAALEGVPKDVMFKDVEDWRKITPPPERIQQMWGSFSWMPQLRIGPYKCGYSS